MPDWKRLFPDADFRLPMGLRAGDAAAYWSSWDATGNLSAERQQWLSESPQWYCGCLPEAGLAMLEAQSWMRQWSAAPEPDWVLLSAETMDEPRVLAGEVVFPSSWSLPEKLGKRMSEVHGPVPALQSEIGAGIQTFLSKIAVGAAWERENWGLSADEELNHHPLSALKGLTSQARLETTWIRLEHQFLTRLPETKSLLFGIRVNHFRLDQVAADAGAARGIVRALETMSEAMARYKGLAEARASLIRQMQLGRC